MPRIAKDSFRLDYWADLRNFLIISEGDAPLPLKLRNRTDQNFDVKWSGTILYGMMRTRDKNISLELYILKKETKIYEKLLQEKNDIEREIGKSLKWEKLPGPVHAKISLMGDFNPNDESDWENQFEWFYENLNLFNNTFGSRF